MIGAYVDDTIATGPAFFDEESRLTECQFVSQPREYDDVKLAGVEIEREDGGSYFMNQKLYAKKLKMLDRQYGFNGFRSLKHQLAWLPHTLDLCAYANILSRVAQHTFANKGIRLIKAAIKKAKDGREGLMRHKLDRDSMRMVVFCD